MDKKRRKEKTEVIKGEGTEITNDISDVITFIPIFPPTFLLSFLFFMVPLGMKHVCPRLRILIIMSSYIIEFFGRNGSSQAII